MAYLRVAFGVLVLLLMGGSEQALAQSGEPQFRRSLLPPTPVKRPPIEWSLDSDGKYRLTVGFEIEFEADGLPTKLRALPNQHPQVTAGLQPQLAELRFTAKDREGRPSRGASTLWVYLEGLQRGDGKFDMQVSRLATAPRAKHKILPKYPRRQLARQRVGATLIRVLVGVDGRAKSITVAEGVPDDDFAREGMKAIAQWRFEPERVNDEAVETSVLVPIRYSIAGLPPARPLWEKPQGAPDDALVVTDSPIGIQPKER